LPHVKEWQKRYTDKGLVVIGVHTPYGAEKLKEFVKEKELNYLVALDQSPDGKKGKTIEKYMVDSFPDYYFIDRKGVLRYADCANRSAEDAIQELLAEK
jgi:hypothetical protein